MIDMARTVRNGKIDTRTARLKLVARREPYWTVLAAGRAIGYRRGARGGNWIARLREEGKQHYEALGAADDVLDADGDAILNFAQAQERARRYFTRKAQELAGGGPSRFGPYTIRNAIDDYFERRDREGSKGLSKDRAASKLRILPDLGDIAVAKLTTKRIRDWHHDLASSAKMSRPSRVAKRKATPIDQKNPEAVRARRATANRTLTVLKAALNQAFHDGHAPSDDAWRKAKPFREVSASVVRYLSADECRRLANACDGSFRDLVRAALLTGCRYGELTRMRVADFNSESRTITVRQSKAGVSRHVALTDEGGALLSELTQGKTAQVLIFLREDGEPWGASHQQRPLDAASRRAKIEPVATFHILRHTYASALAMRGVPMGVIAAQLGHADTRMTEKHYAHLAPNYVAETVRAALPALGIVERSNIIDLRKGAVP